VRGFSEVNLGYDEQRARGEAKRCFHCGTCDQCGVCRLFCPDMSITLGDASTVNILDDFHCKGCGICAQECPRSAIIMERER
jgi:Pyruvate/2-oxoacid:ferredoxin oxidoreductase delta subunit